MLDDYIIRSQDGIYDKDVYQPDYKSIYMGMIQNRIHEDIVRMK